MKLQYMFKRKNKELNENTYLIVGLGNPGKGYKQNRHNVGFLLVNQFVHEENQSFSRLEHKAMISKFQINGNRVIFAKPKTFMNNSGISVGGLSRFYKIPTKQIIVVYDDVDLPFHTLRLKPSGGSGGHNGIKSIVQHLSTDGFSRLRVGINRPPGKMKTPSYVLQDFSKTEFSELPLIYDRGIKAIKCWMDQGIEVAMNTFNQVPEK